MGKGWIGFDLDGTLAEHGEGQFRVDKVGDPIPRIVAKARGYINRGVEIRIMTARVFPLNMNIKPSTSNLHLEMIVHDLIRANEADADRIRGSVSAVKAIRVWCKQHLGQVVAVTNVKDYNMVKLYDDRAVQVLTNQGIIVGE